MMQDKADHCQMCGTSRSVWDEDPYAYEPVVDICPGCQKKDLGRPDKMPAGGTVLMTPKRHAATLRARSAQRQRGSTARARREARTGKG